MTPGDPYRCSRCGTTQRTLCDARQVCDDCAPGTLLCQPCLVVHCQEVLADKEYDMENEKNQAAAGVLALWAAEQERP